MKIEVNIEKKYFFTILVTLLIIGAGIFVYAFNSNPLQSANAPATFGHSGDETQVEYDGNAMTLQKALEAINIKIANNPSGSFSVKDQWDTIIEWNKAVNLCGEDGKQICGCYPLTATKLCLQRGYLGGSQVDCSGDKGDRYYWSGVTWGVASGQSFMYGLNCYK